MDNKKRVYLLLFIAFAVAATMFLVHALKRPGHEKDLMGTAPGPGLHSKAGMTNTVRVAAIQCYSRMGEIDYNRRLLTGLIEKAAGAGAKIIVLPECAVTGYMDPANDIKWTKSSAPDANEALRADARAGPQLLGEDWSGIALGTTTEAHTFLAESRGLSCEALAKKEAPTLQEVGAKTDELDANKVAETVPGPSTEYFGQLAGKLKVYLCISLIEKDKEELFNSQVLLDPDGKVCCHHRKTILWQPGDGLWATKGTLPVKAVETKYGRLGLMICFEYHTLPAVLAKERVDIVLYSVGWYAPNTETWYREIFPRDTVVPNGFSIIVANWSAENDSQGWPGHGYSCIINSYGRVLVMAKKTRGEEIVMADLPVGKATQKKD